VIAKIANDRDRASLGEPFREDGAESARTAGNDDSFTFYSTNSFMKLKML
jgi:hypothetical protein